MDPNNQVVIDTPEGLYRQAVEKLPPLRQFDADHATKIVLAAGRHILINFDQIMFIHDADLYDRVPIRRIDLRQSPQQQTSLPAPQGFITALDYNAEPDSDEYDLLVGFSNGEVRIFSFKAQLESDARSTRPVNALSFNTGGSLIASRCVGLHWLPGTHGASFVSLHANGAIFSHQKSLDRNGSGNLRGDEKNRLRGDMQSLQPHNSNSYSNQIVSPTSPSPPSHLTSKLIVHFGVAVGITASAIHRDFVAVACRDGSLRVLSLVSGHLIGGFRSYFGAFLCCAWSHDGRLIAAGGEDDLIAVWDFKEQEMVGFMEGHMSWVSAVAFDLGPPSYMSGTGSGRLYRLASVGQDCQCAFWDVVVNALDSDENNDDGSNNATVGKGAYDTSIIQNRFVGAIAPSLPRADMVFIEPVGRVFRLHNEPLCDCCYIPEGLLVSSYDGSVRRLTRPVQNQSDIGAGVGC